MRIDGFRRAESGQCLALGGIEWQSGVHAGFYRIDEMFARLVDDAVLRKSMFPELRGKPAQIRLECRRCHAGPSTTARTARAKSRHSPCRRASARWPARVS